MRFNKSYKVISYKFILENVYALELQNNHNYNNVSVINIF